MVMAIHLPMTILIAVPGTSVPGTSVPRTLLLTLRSMTLQLTMALGLMVMVECLALNSMPCEGIFADEVVEEKNSWWSGGVSCQ
jgi:hypothetical protein